MSDDNENSTSREAATETLFNFSEGEGVKKDKLADEELSRVNYEEELSLQNVFLAKEAKQPTDAATNQDAAQTSASTVISSSEPTANNAPDEAVAAVQTSETPADSAVAAPTAERATAVEDSEPLRSSVLQIDQAEATALTTAVPASADAQRAAIEEHQESPQNGSGPEIASYNQAPIAGPAIVATVNEGDAVLSGQLEAIDPDQGDVLRFFLSDVTAAPEGFTLHGDGSFSFDPSVAAYDHLNVGDSLVFTVPVTVADAQGAAANSQIVITVTGSNDAPIAGAAVSTAVDEGSSAISGRMTSTDVDDNATAHFAIADGVGAPDGFVLAEDGTYSFDPANDAYDYLGAGDVITLSIPITVTDDQGASDVSLIQVSIHGTNDAPVAGAAVFASVREGASTISGQLSATDADAVTSLSFALAEGVEAPPGFSLGADGSYSFDPDHAAYENLGAGDTTVITLPITVADDQGATDTSQIQITVTGTNDAPVAGADIAAKVSEGDSAISGQLTSTDVDDGATATFAVSEGAETPAGFILNEDGSYSFDPADEAYDHLNVG